MALFSLSSLFSLLSEMVRGLGRWLQGNMDLGDGGAVDLRGAALLLERPFKCF
eukprot:SAG31_NODE_6280_length_2089_cov_1.747236_1_plen_52_part_10